MNKEKRIVMNRMADMRFTIDDFEDSVLADVHNYHKKATKSVISQLNKTKGRATEQRLLKVLDELTLMLKTIELKQTGSISAATIETAQFANKRISEIVSWDYMADGFNDVSVSKAKLKALVEGAKLGDKTLEEWIGSAYQSQVEGLRAEIISGSLQGKGYKALISGIDNSLRGDIIPAHLDAITRTYIQTANVQAHQTVFQANKDVLNHLEWTAQLENANVKTGRGTCVRCQSLDGMRWEVDDYDRPSIPLHVRCRCMLLPITKTWKELGIDIEEADRSFKNWYERDLATRQKLDQGFTDMNYADFWASKSKSWQNNAVGKRRADLLRSGAIEFSDLVDPLTGELILLKDLVAISSASGWGPTKAAVSGVASRTTMPTMRELEDLMKGQLPSSGIQKKLDDLDRQHAEFKAILDTEKDRTMQTIFSKQIYDNRQEYKKLLKGLNAGSREGFESAIIPGGSGVPLLDPSKRAKTLINKNKDSYDDALRIAGAMIDDSVLKQAGVIGLDYKKGTRAHYKHGNKTITMGNLSASEMLHEFGHAIEEGSKEVSKAMSQFLNKRARGYKLTRIGNTDELGWEDDFFDHYVGRAYDHNATEILSMGLELMLTDPVKFFNEDREHFELTLKVMWGKL